MTSLPASIQRQGSGLAVFVNPPDHNTMLALITHLAIRQPVRVVIGGNKFRAFDLSRIIRRQTVKLHEVLGRIEVARPFTCYQAVALFEQLTTVAQPLVVLDLLATFADENISTSESYRLMRVVKQHLNWLRNYAPVIVSVSLPPQPDRAGLIDLLTADADYVLKYEAPAQPTALTLF